MTVVQELEKRREAARAGGGARRVEAQHAKGKLTARERVELLLDDAPGVQESAVIGLPHPDFGEAVFAVLVAEPGVVLDADAVLSGIGDRLARFKQPKAAVVVADLPRNTMGKVQKNVLRQTYAGWFAG